MNNGVNESENSQNIVKHATGDVEDQIQPTHDESQPDDDIFHEDEEKNTTDAVSSEDVVVVKTKTDSAGDIGWA